MLIVLWHSILREFRLKNCVMFSSPFQNFQRQIRKKNKDFKLCIFRSITSKCSWNPRTQLNYFNSEYCIFKNVASPLIWKTFFIHFKTKKGFKLWIFRSPHSKLYYARGRIPLAIPVGAYHRHQQQSPITTPFPQTLNISLYFWFDGQCLFQGILT